MATSTIAQPTRFHRTLNLDEAAEFLGIHKQTLRVRAKLGEIPGARVGRAWRFIEEDLVNHLRSLYAQSRQVPQGTIMENSLWVPINAATSGGSGSRTQTETKYADLLGLGKNGKRRSLKTD